MSWVEIKRRGKKEKRVSLVTLSNRSDQLANEYDVYIGPRKWTKDFDLAASKWANPFEAVAKTDPQRANEMYRRHILSSPQLRQDLPNLQGKKLGCFCANMKNCHGNVLLDLVNNLTPTVHLKSTDSTAVFFRGKNCPLSHYYNSPLVYDSHKFESAMHLFAYRVLMEMKQYISAKKVRRSDNSREANNILRNIQKIQMGETSSAKRDFMRKGKAVGNSRQIEILYDILLQKWETCKAFREDLQLWQNYNMVEATRSTYWGCGEDLVEIHSKTNPQRLGGKNISGWVIKFLQCKKAEYLMLKWNSAVAKLRNDQASHYVSHFEYGMIIVDEILN